MAAERPMRTKSLIDRAASGSLVLQIAVGIAGGIALSLLSQEAAKSAMILGDNVFYGQGLQPELVRAAERSRGAKIFAYPVKHPEAYGVVEVDANERPVRLVEKPEAPKSRLV